MLEQPGTNRITAAVARAATCLAILPMNVLPEKFEVKYTQLCIDGMLSNRKVSEISDMIKKLFDTNAEIQRPKGIDLLGIQGNNMVTMSTVLSVVLLVQQFYSF